MKVCKSYLVLRLNPCYSKIYVSKNRSVSCPHLKYNSGAPQIRLLYEFFYTLTNIAIFMALSRSVLEATCNKTRKNIGFEIRIKSNHLLLTYKQIPKNIFRTINNEICKEPSLGKCIL